MAEEAAEACQTPALRVTVAAVALSAARVEAVVVDKAEAVHPDLEAVTEAAAGKYPIPQEGVAVEEGNPALLKT